MNENRQCRFYRLCSFLLPVLILVLYFAVKQVSPFGNSTFLIHDMNAQYVDFYAYLRTVLTGKNNFLYSFSRGLGGDFPSFFSYYLISPFNLIPVLFSDELMPVGISLEMLLLFGLSGFSCFLSLQYFTGTRGKSGNPFFLLFLSSAYSLSGWMVLNAENFQFLPEASVLPMVIISCEKAKNGKKLPAVLWIAAALILNFYIGYMICIFAFLWMVIPVKKDPSAEVSQPRFRLIDLLLIFGGALLISAPVLISVIRQAGITVKGTDAQWYQPVFNFSVPDFLRKFLPGQFDHIQYRDNGLPAVYCSLTACCAALYFFIFRRDAAHWIHHLIIFSVLVFSLFFRPLTMAWQGFSQPHWWPYRFSFLLIYIIILCASECRLRIPWFALIPGFASLIFNMFVTYDIKLEEAQPLNVYSTAVAEKAALLSSLDTGDELYRIEDMAPRSDNDAMHFAYAGVTHFDSLANRKIFAFLKKLGFPQDRYTLQYGLGNTQFANSLLGVRHILSEGALLRTDPVSSVAYLMHREQNNALKSSDDPYAFQNEIAALIGFDEPALKTVPINSFDLVNLECDDVFCWKTDYEADAAFIFHLMLPAGNYLYGHLNNEFPVGDLFYQLEDGTETAVVSLDSFVPLGYSEEGGDTVISVRVDSPILDFPDLTFYAEDPENVSTGFAALSEDVHVLKKSSSELLIQIPVQNVERMLLVTIPFDKGWKAYNGKNELRISEIWDAFLSVSIPSGVSEITLSYH